MFITKSVTVTISPSNYKHFQKFYDNFKIKDKIDVEIEHLNTGSNSIIKVCCDVCGCEKELKYKNYTTYGYIDGEYLCRKCKMRKNNQEKYGVDCVFQLDEIKEKSKKTVKEKYGVEYISQSNVIQDTIKKNNLIKYGTEHHLQNENILNKLKSANLEKYGVENILQLEKNKEKSLNQ